MRGANILYTPLVFVTKLQALARLTRVEHGIMAALATLVGYALAAGGWSRLQPTLSVVAVVVTLAVEMGLFTFNDIFNLEEDRVNAPDRPLVRGEIGIKEAWMIGLLTLAFGLALASCLGLVPTIIVVLAVATGMAYNVALKRTGFWGNVIVALDTALPFLFGSSIACGLEMPWTSYFLTMIAFFATLGREVLKGIVDVEGDRKAGIRTIAVVKGTAFAAFVSGLLTLAAVAMSLLAVFALPIQKRLPYLISIAPVDIIFVYVACSLLLREEKGFAKRGRRLTLIAMLLGILAFAIIA